MLEYEYGVQWKSTREVIYAGAEDHCRTVYQQVLNTANVSKTFPDRPILVRRPKGDWEEVK
jgi:hypothetical protein